MIGLNGVLYRWLSEDLSAGVFDIATALNPGDPIHVDPFNNQIRNLYQWEGSVRDAKILLSPTGPADKPPALLGVSPNEQAYFYSDSSSGYGDGRLWRQINGERTEVGVLPEPDGTSVSAGLGADIIGGNVATPGSISTDGNRAFFFTRPFVTYPPLYLRVLGPGTPRTELISGSERSSDDPMVPHDAQFELAAADGSVAFFISTDPLAEGSTPKAGGDNPVLYRWNSNADPGSRLTDLTSSDPAGVSGAIGAIGASSDATTVYFVARGVLAEDAIRGRPNLYQWQEGEGTKFIASLREGDRGTWLEYAIV